MKKKQRREGGGRGLEKPKNGTGALNEKSEIPEVINRNSLPSLPHSHLIGLREIV